MRLESKCCGAPVRPLIDKHGCFDGDICTDCDQPCDTQAPRCDCGSNLERYELVDARGIFCSYVCADCEEEVKSHYRPEIFEDGNYECLEEVGDY
jgi:hypothetical protein